MYSLFGFFLWRLSGLCIIFLGLCIIFLGLCKVFLGLVESVEVCVIFWSHLSGCRTKCWLSSTAPTAAQNAQHAQHAQHAQLNSTHSTNSAPHRFGHQSGWNESSGRNSTILENGFAFRVYVVVSRICKNTNIRTHTIDIHSKY